MAQSDIISQLSCPECGSTKLYRDGLRYLDNGRQVQRWLCRGCGFRFSDRKISVNVKAESSEALDSGADLGERMVFDADLPVKESFDDGSLSFGKDASVHRVTNIGKGLNALLSYNSNHRVCAEKAKNLAATETQTVAGDTKTINTAQGQIVDYAWKLKKRGLSEYTIKNRTSKLNRLQQLGANLMNPETVETVLATETWTPSSKQMAVSAYANFTKTLGIPWTPIKVHYQPREPFIPTEGELDQLIAGCGKRTGTFLQTLKDTAARSGEACKIKWTDLNDQNNTISINNAEKGSDNRTVKVSPKTIAMLKSLPMKYGEYIFNPRLSRSMLGCFIEQRKKLAANLQNPRLLLIHFHTFRHWKATMEYKRTRNILHVKHLLGHKRLENTEIYTHLIEFESSDYHVAHAKTIEEEDKLIESGFELVRHDQSSQITIYRKLK